MDDPSPDMSMDNSAPGTKRVPNMVLWFHAAVADNAKTPTSARWPTATSVLNRKSARRYTLSSSPKLSTPSTLLFTNSRRESTDTKVSPKSDCKRHATRPPVVWLTCWLGPAYQLAPGAYRPAVSPAIT